MKSDLIESKFSASFKNGLTLALFALVSTGLIAIVQLLTKDKIATEVKAATARRLNQIIPADSYDNNAYNDCLLVNAPQLLGSNQSKIYRMRKDSQNYAVFVSAIAPDGYAGQINFVVGVYQTGKIAGVRITEHKETPGLGDKIEIEKSSWIRQFDNKSITDPSVWQVKKDGGQFDALTGATITPRAVIKGIYNTLHYIEKNKNQIYELPANCGEMK